MDGIPPALPTDSEDIAWALETAEALWRRGERVDAVVWVRRAAQAAGEGDDARRAVVLAKYAAELGDWIGAQTSGESADNAPSEGALEAVDALLAPSEGSLVALSMKDVEIVSAQDFEAGFESVKPEELTFTSRHPGSDPEVMTVSLNAPDVELIDGDDDTVEEFPEEEPTPIRSTRSPIPEIAVRSAAEAHAGMLDPWADGDGSRPPPPPNVPRALAPPIVPKPRPPAEPPEAETDTTTYRQINPRVPRPSSIAPASPDLNPIPRGGLPRPRVPSFDRPATRPEMQAAPRPRASVPPRPVAPLRPASLHPASLPPASLPPTSRSSTSFPPTSRPPTSLPPTARAVPPTFDLLDVADSVAPEERGPETPGRTLTPASARPTAPPPDSMPREAFPSVVTMPPEAAAQRARVSSAPPTQPAEVPARPSLDLGNVEALSDLADDARDAFALAATMHTIATDEEVSHFALALVVEGEIDVSATIVDAPALRLERNSILRSRGSILPGVALRLVCASPTALVATWNDAAVAAAFRTCPWVEEDLRVVTDRVQASAGVTMGPLGERFDQALREHLTSKLTLRNLAPGEVLIAQGKPTPIALVGIGDLSITKNGQRGETLRPGDFVFPSQTLAHAPAPATATAGAGGAVVLYGDRAVAQELLMSFPPLLEVLATL